MQMKTMKILKTIYKVLWIILRLLTTFLELPSNGLDKIKPKIYDTEDTYK